MLKPIMHTQIFWEQIGQCGGWRLLCQLQSGNGVFGWFKAQQSQHPTKYMQWRIKGRIMVCGAWRQSPPGHRCTRKQGRAQPSSSFFHRLPRQNTSAAMNVYSTHSSRMSSPELLTSSGGISGGGSIESTCSGGSNGGSDSIVDSAISSSSTSTSNGTSSESGSDNDNSKGILASTSYGSFECCVCIRLLHQPVTLPCGTSLYLSIIIPFYLSNPIYLSICLRNGAVCSQSICRPVVITSRGYLYLCCAYIHPNHTQM